MIKLLQLLLHGCAHKWVTIQESSLVESESSTIPHGRRYYCRCEKCGRYTKFDCA